MKTSKHVDLNDLPGHLIRRLQQIAVGTFMDETKDLNVTPVQFALLFAAARRAGLDQRTLAGAIGFDTSTLGAVIDRLEARGLIRRSTSPDDKRVRLLSVTRAGDALLVRATPAMTRAQARMLAPLGAAERRTFMRLARIVVAAADTAGPVDRDA